MQMTGIVAIIMAGLIAGYTTGEGRDFLDKGSRKVESGGYSAKEELAALEIPENMLAYWMVVNGKKPFVSAGEGCQEFYWDEYFWCCSELLPGFKVYDFGIVDLDGDGMTELVITGFPDTSWVLDYQEGKVYSYQFVFRGMAGITVDGIYSSSSASDIGGFHRIHFDKGTYEEETLAYMHGDYFEVEGVEVSADAFFAYVEPFNKAELMESVDFTKEMLDKILLGDLEEEELSVVKHAEPEKICKENDPEEAKVPEVYLAVLTGKEEFVCATEGGQSFMIHGNKVKNPAEEESYQILYFSMVDMDGDGEDEVVLSCGGDWEGKTLVLHASESGVYGYMFAFRNGMGAIANDGVFQTGYATDNKYGRVISFEADGCRIEPVTDYGRIGRNRIRYYFFGRTGFVFGERVKRFESWIQ